MMPALSAQPIKAPPPAVAATFPGQAAAAPPTGTARPPTPAPSVSATSITASTALVAAWLANEPWIRGRVLLNPHAAFYSPDSYVDQRTKGAQTALYYLRDGTLVNCVNGEYLGKRR